MEELNKNFDRKSLWNEAGKAGLFLGCVSIAYVIITSLTSTLKSSATGFAFLISILNFALWAAKFAGCIYLMKVFMQKFADNYQGVDNRISFRFGTVTALLSALLYSAYTLASILVSGTEKLVEEYNEAISQYSSMLDTNSLNAIESISENLPTITFFSNFIWCFLFGMILSAILSKKIPSNNPFDL